MTRINLLAPERTSTGKKTRTTTISAPSGPPGAIQAYVFLTLFVGGAIVVCAGAWWYQTDLLKRLDTQIAADEKREKDLQAIKQQVDHFQQRKALLENKVLVIEKLKLTQKSPVHMLDEISKALPDMVWLNEMNETHGSVSFKGQSNSLAAVADFMAALGKSGWFPQVELGGAQDQADLVRFDVVGQFVDPEVAKKEAAAREAAARLGPAAKPGARPGGR